jgi:hypothetical protein
MEMLEGEPPNLTKVVIFGSPCMVYRKPGKKSLRKRSQRGLILGVSEEVKGYTVYLMDDKKVITTKDVKNIATLSGTQNSSFCAPYTTALMRISKTAPVCPHMLSVASQWVELWKNQPAQTSRRPLPNTQWPSRW